MGFGRGKGFSPPPAPPPEEVVAKGGFVLLESGDIRKSGADWDTVHDAATGIPYEASVTNYVTTRRSTTTYYVDRAVFRFDTSVIPDDAVIQAASLSISPRTVMDYGNPSVILVSGEGLGDLMAVEDYGTLLAHVTPMAPAWAIGDLVLNAYNDFVLNAAGLALINKTGWSKFGMRTSFDIDDIPPLGAVRRARVEFAGQADTVRPPILAVAYSD